MFLIGKYLFLLAALLLVHAASATTIFECIDENGRTSFQDRCTPGMQVGAERTLGKQNKVPELQVYVYTVPNCRACDAVKAYLDERNIAYQEKNVEAAPDKQAELKQLVGSLKIPTTIIEQEIISAYDKDKLDATLKKVGWKQIAPIDR